MGVMRLSEHESIHFVPKRAKLVMQPFLIHFLVDFMLLKLKAK